MSGASLAWGTAFVLLGVLVAFLPGSAGGPRVGVVALLVTVGLTVALLGNVGWFLRRTTRPEDYRGTCPVGAACPACGAFNLKPRTTCRLCHAALAAAPTPDAAGEAGAESGAEAL